MIDSVRRLLLIAAAVCCLACRTAAAQTPTYQIVPFTFDEVTPNPVVQVKVNDGPPLLFIVDTGTAAPVVIQPWVRDQLGLKRSASSPVSDDAPETDTIDSFALVGKDGDVRFDPSQAYVVDLGILDSVYGPHKIAGLIGVGLFSTTAAEFDFVAKALVIYENADPFHIDGASVLPLTMNQEGVATVKVTVAPGKSTDLPVDTGGMFTGLPTSLTTSLDATAVITRHWTGQVGGMYMCPDFLLPSLDVGGVDIPNVVVETLPESARCTIGLNVLTRYRTIVDIPHGNLILAPRTDGVGIGSNSLPFREGPGVGYGRGWTGIHFDPGSTAWRVRDLETGSPAAKAGVKPGDVITAIDGYPLEGMTNPAVFHLLDSDAGSTASLAIRRAGKAVNVKFERGDEFAAPKLPFDGLMLHKPDGESMGVIGVQKGCAADKAGVHAGDTITRINGQPTDAMTVDQMHQAALDPAAHLQITRTGTSKPLQIDLMSSKPSKTPSGAHASSR